MMLKFKYFLTTILLLAGFMTLMDDGGAKADSEKKLLVFGDSLVAGYGLPASEAFPVRLEEMLRKKGHAVMALNGGVSGDTTAGGASRIDWALADNPDAVMVVLGGNDALRGLPPEALEANLNLVLAAIIDRGLPVLLAVMKAPANMGRSYADAFDQAYIRVIEKAKADGGRIFVYPFFLDGVALEPHLNQDDGIHPNPAGVAVIVERILPSVETLLNETAKE